MPRPKAPAEQIEARRRQALQLLEKGYSLNKVGRIIGSAASSVMRWRETLQAGGEQALKVRFSPGRPPSLSATERAKLVQQLLRGAMANGFGSEVWTTERVAVVIHRFCQTQFHRSHVVRLMHDWVSNAKARNPSQFLWRTNVWRLKTRAPVSAKKGCGVGCAWRTCR